MKFPRFVLPYGKIAVLPKAVDRVTILAVGMDDWGSCLIDFKRNHRYVVYRHRGLCSLPLHFAHKGALTKVRPDDLAANTVKGLVERLGIDPESIEDLVLGNAMPEGEQGLNMARMVGLLAGLPQSVGGVTVNRFCGSSMQTIHDAAGQISLGAGEAYIAAGVESMSRVPMGGFNPCQTQPCMQPTTALHGHG